MVAKAEIWTPARDAEAFSKEVYGEFLLFAKDAALKLKCDIEQLKFTLNDRMQYSFGVMTDDEFAENEKQRIINKKIKAIRDARG